MSHLPLMTGLDHKPICLLNTDGFFDGSIQQLKQMHDGSLLYDDPSTYFHVASTPTEALDWCLAELEAISYVRAEDLTPEGRVKIRDNTLYEWPYIELTEVDYLAATVAFVAGLAIGIGGFELARRYFKRT